MTDSIRIARDCHREAVEHLLAGRPEEAVRLLEPDVVDDSPSESVLVLAKAYLAIARGNEASRLLEGLLARAGSRADPGMHAYLKLLAASAASLDARPGDAIRHLEEVSRVDSRMEYAAIDLKRRMEKGLPPDIRF